MTNEKPMAKALTNLMSLAYTDQKQGEYDDQLI